MLRCCAGRSTRSVLSPRTRRQWSATSEVVRPWLSQVLAGGNATAMCPFCWIRFHASRAWRLLRGTAPPNGQPAAPPCKAPPCFARAARPQRSVPAGRCQRASQRSPDDARGRVVVSARRGKSLALSPIEPLRRLRGSECTTASLRQHCTSGARPAGGSRSGCDARCRGRVRVRLDVAG